MSRVRIASLRLTAATAALVPAALALLLGAAGCGSERPDVALPPDVAASAEQTQPLAVGAAMPDVELREVDELPPATLLGRVIVIHRVKG